MKYPWFYQIFEENNVENSHIIYGIALYRNRQAVKVIGDISPDRAALEGLVRVFNEEGLDPVHFEQAVEDFLYDNSI